MANAAEIEAVGMHPTEAGQELPAVVLAVGDEVLPIFVTSEQAHAITTARGETATEIPEAHDLLLEMVTDFGGRIHGVRIDVFLHGTFFAKIDVDVPDDGSRQRVVFDARPSDGIALAARVDCPISVADEVLDIAGCQPERLDRLVDTSTPSKDADGR